MNTGMTRSYRRSTIQPLVVMENGKEFHLEVLLKLLALGFKAREIPTVLTWQAHKLARDARQPRKSSTKILNTIATHLKFILIAQPVKYFALTAGTTSILSAGFIAAAVYNLVITHEPSAFYALIGLNLLLFALVLAGFSVVLYQIREAMIAAWMQAYPTPHPPSARPGAEVHGAPTTVHEG
jgi:hypothetical protein